MQIEYHVTASNNPDITGDNSGKIMMENALSTLDDVFKILKEKMELCVMVLKIFINTCKFFQPTM